MKIAALLLLFILGSRAWSADISGTIQDEKSRPIPDATVKIYTARMRSGDSPMCPSCWADCLKLAKTDGKGVFQIKNVSDHLVFRLLVMAKGFDPAFLNKVDPKKGPLQETLKARDLASFHDKRIITGTITGPDGKPVTGATVEPEFSPQGLDPMTISDESGQFTLTSSQDIEDNRLNIRAEGFAPACRKPVCGGATPLSIKLSHGVVISGRVADHGKPVPNAGVGIVQSDRDGENWLGPQTTTTDDRGYFHFDHAPANLPCLIYGLMDSVGTHGAVPAKAITTGADESSLAVGDLAIVPAGFIHGRLHEADGRPFPPGTRISLSRERAWDLHTIDVAPDGSFAATGVPLGEQFNISVPRDHEIRKVSPGFSIDQLNARVLGTLSQSLPDFTIELLWKSDKEMESERKTKWVTDRYADFLAQEKFTPDQLKLFLSAKAAEREIMTHAQQGSAGYFAARAQADTVLQKQMTDDFGPKIYQDYFEAENRANGRIILNWFYRPPQDSWLTDNEQEKLASSLGRVTLQCQREWALEKEKLSKPEQLAQSTHYIDQLEAEGKKVLPQTKYAAYEKALADFRKNSAEMIANSAD